MSRNDNESVLVSLYSLDITLPQYNHIIVAMLSVIVIHWLNILVESMTESNLHLYISCILIQVLISDCVSYICLTTNLSKLHLLFI